MNENQIKETLTTIANEITAKLPNTGFVLLTYEFNKTGRTMYISNSNREDVLKAMQEFIDKNTENPEMFGKDVEEEKRTN